MTEQNLELTKDLTSKTEFKYIIYIISLILFLK